MFRNKTVKHLGNYNTGNPGLNQRKQLDSFVNKISIPPESVASMASMPITSFEDTQQMLRAYKKKKRELAKIKEQFFKLETEFITVKEKAKHQEEDVAMIHKKLAKAEKALK